MNDLEELAALIAKDWTSRSVDDAWAAAIAAMPERCVFEGIRRSMLGMKDRWIASYSSPFDYQNFYGDTPSAALRDLLASLGVVAE